MGLEVEDSCLVPPPLSLHPHHDLRVLPGPGPHPNISDPIFVNGAWMQTNLMHKKTQQDADGYRVVARTWPINTEWSTSKPKQGAEDSPRLALC